MCTHQRTPALYFLRPPKSVEQYVPRIFGFKLHPTAYGNREPAPARNSQRRIASREANAKDGQQKQEEDSL